MLKIKMASVTVTVGNLPVDSSIDLTGGIEASGGYYEVGGGISQNMAQNGSSITELIGDFFGPGAGWDMTLVSNGRYAMCASPAGDGRIQYQPPSPPFSQAYWTLFCAQVGTNQFVSANTSDFSVRKGSTVLTLNTTGSPVSGGGWTISWTSSVITLTPDTPNSVWTNLPYIYLDASAFSSADRPDRIFWNSTNISYVGVQGLAASDVKQPPNCLASNTLIQVSLDGETKPIYEMVSGNKVVVKDKDGKETEVEVQILRTKRPQPEMSYEIGPVTVARSHILLLPEGERNEWMEEGDLCEKCQKKLGKGYGEEGCKRCGPVQVKGYKPLLLFHSSSPKIKKTLYLALWYHILLPKEHRNKGILLGNGWLSESFRHDLGSSLRDSQWMILS